MGNLRHACQARLSGLALGSEVSLGRNLQDLTLCSRAVGMACPRRLGGSFRGCAGCRQSRPQIPQCRPSRLDMKWRLRCALIQASV